MQFWRLEHPDYESDYKHSYINGELEHPFSLPGIRCDVCRETWGGSRILPFELPASLRHRKHLKDRWPISLEQHQALQREVQDEFRRVGVDIPSFRPGDDFQPCYLDVPSRPRADFIWGCLGSVIIAERVRQLFESIGVASVAYSPVTLRKVGKREARLPAPIPSTGEPEDIIDEVPLLTRTGSIGPYFETDMEAEVFIVSKCCPVGCGFDVLLLRARDSGIIFVYCDACGCTWSDPGAARFERGLDEITPPYVVTRDGVEIPSHRDITDAGFESFVLRAERISDLWEDVVARVNAAICKHATV